MAQLGARLNGIQEVTGSIPVGSTKQTGEFAEADSPVAFSGIPSHG